MKKAALIAWPLLPLAVVLWRAAANPPPSSISGGLSDRDRAQLRTLTEVLVSRNDNDPRLDRDFNALSPEVKAQMRGLYAATPPERRNERGTIVFLLGRKPETPEDWAFLKIVASEPPCLSLADCSKPPKPGEAADEVTLAYPSLVALRQAEQAWSASPPPRPEAAKAVWEASKSSMQPALQRLAARLEPKFR